MSMHSFSAVIQLLCIAALCACQPSPEASRAPEVPLSETAGTPGGARQTPLPDLVALSDIDPSIATDVRYAGSDNFLGRPVKGYEGRMDVLVAREAAIALSAAQNSLDGLGIGLKVFDAYRPQTAVDDFVEWSRDPADTLTKSLYYPGLDKPSLFELGYIAKTSGHTLGYTVDLTLIDLRTGLELDMGSRFDYFGDISHHGASGITAVQQANRMQLRSAMEAAGFAAYDKEWWHYRLDR